MLWLYDLQNVLNDKKLRFQRRDNCIIVTVNISKNSKIYDKLICFPSDPSNKAVSYGSFQLTNEIDIDDRIGPLLHGTIYSAIDFEQRILHTCFDTELDVEHKLKVLKTEYTVDALGRDIEALKHQITLRQSHDTQQIRTMETQLQSLTSQMAKVVELLHTIAGNITDRFPRQ
jgi:hypothetical protein